MVWTPGLVDIRWGIHDYKVENSNPQTLADELLLKLVLKFGSVENEK